MGYRKLLLLVLMLGVSQLAQSQSPTYGVGRRPTEAEIQALDIAISPEGKELPPGHGDAKEGAALYVKKGCAGCHGATGNGGKAPILVKTDGKTESKFPCLSPCINDTNVMGRKAPYAVIMWDYINRGMPLNREGSLTPDEVYAITAYLLFKNGVIAEAEVLTEVTLPKVKMPNREGFAMPHEWKPGEPVLHGYPKPH